MSEQFLNCFDKNKKENLVSSLKSPLLYKTCRILTFFSITLYNPWGNYFPMYLYIFRIKGLKGYLKWKNRFERILLYGRTFEITKIRLYSCRVFHFSLEIFEFVWYINKSTAYVTLHNDFLDIRNITEVVEQNHLKLCVCMNRLVLNQKIFEPFNGIMSKIYLIS